MKKYIFFTLIFVLASVACAGGPKTIADDVRFELNHANGQYAVGDTVYVIASGKYEQELEVTVSRFSRRGETLPVGKVSGRDTLYSVVATEPTATVLEFREAGTTPEELPKDIEKGDNAFRIGFIVGAESFKPGNEAPADVHEFWESEVQKMRALPMNAQSILVEQKDSKIVECYDVELAAPDGIPVRGYYARPRNASAKSHPIIILFHAAGISGNYARAKVKDAVRYAKEGAICFDFNALGMKNDQPQSYYDSLATDPSLKGYSSWPLVDKDTYFFKNMILRAVRGLDYAAMDPAWDGKTVVLKGESQGGYQCAMLAGIDSRVTDIVVTVPAGVGTCGSKAGRCDSWPNVLTHSDHSPYAIANAPYFDGAILLQGCKANCTVEVGLIDTLCLPAEIFSGFNGVHGKVTYLTFPYRCHFSNLLPSQYRPLWESTTHSPRSHALREALNR